MKLPLLSGRRALSALQRLGFIEIHRKGSHVKMEHPDGRRIVFPFHNEVDRYTLKGALQDADIDTAEFLNQVRWGSPTYAVREAGQLMVRSCCNRQSVIVGKRSK